ncbi:MAG: glutaredoxin family protein [Actinomycetota bacterium]
MTDGINPKMTLFSTEWCGHCRRLKRGLEEAGIDYREIDVDADESAAAAIMIATGGPRTVPTVAVDGRLLVNPSVGEVVHAAHAAGETG